GVKGIAGGVMHMQRKIPLPLRESLRSWRPADLPKTRQKKRCASVIQSVQNIGDVKVCSLLSSALAQLRAASSGLSRNNPMHGEQRDPEILWLLAIPNEKSFKTLILLRYLKDANTCCPKIR